REPPSGGGPLGVGYGLAVFLCPVELRDGRRADFGDRLLHLVRILAAGLLHEVAGADLALDLQVRALDQIRGIFAEFSPGDDSVPRSLRLSLSGLAVLPAPPGRE